MRIAVNTRFLIKNKMEGFGWFTYETLVRIVRQHPQVEFIFIFDRPYDDSFIFGENVKPVVIGPQARHPILFKIWFNRSVRKVLNRTQPDLFLSPDGYLCLFTDVPQLAVIHDLNFEHFPEDLPRSARKYLLRYFPAFARKARRIATVSNYSKSDIVSQYGIRADKIDVVYNGVSEVYHPVDEVVVQATRAKFSDGKPYFVYVGSLHPRKNLIRLMQAYDDYANDGGKADLVIVGERYWWNKEMESCYDSMDHKERVRFIGHLDQAQLRDVIASSLAMTYVSYFEGFGIPALEAMRCGVPLIAANTTSLPEVAGEAALLVDPFKVDEISTAMTRIDSDEHLRNELVKKGHEQASKFDWQKTADGLWESMMKCMRNA